MDIMACQPGRCLCLPTHSLCRVSSSKVVHKSAWLSAYRHFLKLFWKIEQTLSESTGLKNRFSIRAPRILHVICFVAVTALPVATSAEILWSGDFENGTLGNHAVDPSNITLHGTPPYGRALQYGGQPKSHVGNGDLMWLTDGQSSGAFKRGPRRGNNSHSLALFVKSKAGGGIESLEDPTDCDGGSTKTCNRRRTELRSWTRHWEANLMPQMSERWGSVSIFVPNDYDTTSPTSGFSPLVWQWKTQANHSTAGGPPFAISIEDGAWRIRHRWDEQDPPTNDSPWQWAFQFTPNYPNAKDWPDGLKFFPDEAASKAALANLNKGGWTDFVVHVRLDGMEPSKGGQGFLDLWMRSDSGSWIHALSIFASKTTRGGMTFEHGIMYKGNGEKARYGFVPTLYMGRDQVWNLPGPGRLLYFDNMKIGSERASFSDMSHDGSSPGSPPAQGDAAPKAPARVGVD